ncbi:MAG: hypothetical protein Kow00120_29330 [Anaerolineae bacterium]
MRSQKDSPEVDPLNQDEVTKELIARLRRIEGQARGVQRMIEEKRDCKQIMAQLTAMRNATFQAGLVLARGYAAQCLASEGGAVDVDALVALFSQATS